MPRKPTVGPPVQFRLPLAVDAELEGRARAQGLTRSEYARQALIDALAPTRTSDRSEAPRPVVERDRPRLVAPSAPRSPRPEVVPAVARASGGHVHRQARVAGSIPICECGARRSPRTNEWIAPDDEVGQDDGYAPEDQSQEARPGRRSR
jgi:hypothetical protein